ncbi:MAG: hypothetical protein ACYTFW_17090 [Planctomycetota bacterium]|jgi:hypothetical protein
MRKLVDLAKLTCIIALTACVSSVPLTAEKKASIKSISINNHVQMPDAMFYRGPEYALGAFDIPVEYIEKSIGEIIQYLMRESKIDVTQIVREQFINGIEVNRIFESIVSESGDAEIRLSIRIYGFAYEISSKLKPMLGVEGSLIKSDDSVLWKKYAYVTNLNKSTPSSTLGQFFNNPELMREALTVATQIVVEDLVNDMQGY